MNRWKWLAWLCVLLFSVNGIVFSAKKETPKTKTEKTALKAPSKDIAWTFDLNKAISGSAKNGRPVIAYFTYDT